MQSLKLEPKWLRNGTYFNHHKFIKIAKSSTFHFTRSRLLLLLVQISLTLVESKTRRHFESCW